MPDVWRSAVRGAGWLARVAPIAAFGRVAGAGLGLTAAVALAAPPSEAPSAPRPAPQRCHLPGLPQPAVCATLDRPLDPSQASGPRIALHYAVLPALARHKAADPVVFFAGGPGQSAMDLAGAMAARFARVNQRRDLVFIDQRGTGRSAPLRCEDDLPGAGAAPLARSWTIPQRLSRLEACRRALQQLPHGDLRQYSTSSAMQDVEAVRQALGVSRLNLVGGSYGTRAALEYLRLYPQHVRRVVLDGVAPADMRLPEAAATDTLAAWQALLQACAAAPRCAQQAPDLAARWQALLGTLPRSTTLRHPVTGLPETVVVDADTLGAWLRAPLYAPWLAAALPAGMALALQGQFQPLMALGTSLAAGQGGFATGQHFSVVCSEDLGPNTPRPTTVAGGLPMAAAHAEQPALSAGLSALYQQACAAWPKASVPPAFYTVGPSPVPVWLLSGGQDPVTPPRHGARVAQALGPWARHIVAPQAGHGLLALACVRQAVQPFLDLEDDRAALEAGGEPLTRCLADLPRPLAFVPPRQAFAHLAVAAPVAAPPALPASSRTGRRP